MFKKAILSVIAFSIGAMVSISIQACADNEDEIFKSNSSSNSDSSSSNSSCNCSVWDLDKVASCTIYDAQGNKSMEYKNTFNNKGWLIKQICISYNANYKTSETARTYTYSSSGDIRYGTTTYTYYNSSGQIIQTQQTTDEYRLYK